MTWLRTDITDRGTARYFYDEQDDWVCVEYTPHAPFVPSTPEETG
jgi:hypothetical protein